MDLLTGGLILGGVVLAAKVFGGGSKATGKPATTTKTDADCMDAAKDCAALIACAGPILAKATAADTVVLTKMSATATKLGCTDLVSQISKKLADLGLGGVGVKTDLPPPVVSADGYAIVHKVGSVRGVGEGDMIVVGLVDVASNQKYLTTLIFSNPSDPIGTYEKVLAEIALDKFKKEVTKTGVDPTSLLGAFFVTGAPSSLKDGVSFKIELSLGFSLGDVIAVVTKEQMKSGITSTPISDALGLVAGEEDFLPMDDGNVFGGNFGSGGGYRGNLGSSFGSRSKFGSTTSIGG